MRVETSVKTIIISIKLKDVLYLQLANKFAAAYVVAGGQEWYVVGSPSDIGRLHAAGFVERAWQIKLDNGHRPYAVLQRIICFAIDTQPTDRVKNQLTQSIAAATGLAFTDDFHLVTDTYLFRLSAAFWDELWVDFATQGKLQVKEYYAMYRGVVQPLIQNIKFSRLA